MDFCHELLPVKSLALDTSEEGRVTGGGQRMDAEIDPQDFRPVVTRLGIDICGEREAEEKPAFKALDQCTLSNFPIQILLKTFGDFNEELDPAIQSREGEHGPVLSNSGTPREIIADRQCFGNLGFRFSASGHLQGLFDGITRQLGVELEPRSNSGIAQVMEGGLVHDLVFPYNINAKLDGVGKDTHGFPEEVRTIREFNFRSNHGFHIFIWMWEPNLKNLTSIPPPPCSGDLLEGTR